MSEPWGDGTDDTLEVELADFIVQIDRVSDLDSVGGSGPRCGLGEMRIWGGLEVTVRDLTPQDMRKWAKLLIAFADLLDGDPAEPE